MVTADMKFVSTGNNSEPPNLMGAAMLSSRDAHPLPPKLGLRGSKYARTVLLATMATVKCSRQSAQEKA